MNLGNFIKVFMLLLVIGVMGTIGVLYSRNKSLSNELNRYKSNEYALISENDSLKSNSIEYQYTIDQLVRANDSISLKINQVVKELNIQKKKLSKVEYIETKTVVHDSIYFETPVFVEGVKIDTTLTDNKWYFIDLGLEYPGKVSVSPSFKDELFVIFEDKKQCLDTPKKFFVARWFQKKHTVVSVTVHNNNPYSTTESSKFVNIIK